MNNILFLSESESHTEAVLDHFYLGGGGQCFFFSMGAHKKNNETKEKPVLYELISGKVLIKTTYMY